MTKSSVLNAQTYCTPTYSSSCTSGDYIDSFVIKDGTTTVFFTNASGCDNSTTNYIFRTGAGDTIVLTKGKSYDLTAATGTYGQYFVLWIDGNKNGWGDASDVIAESGARVSPWTVTFTAPSGTGSSTYDTTRWRIRSSYYIITGADSCSNQSYGETEDHVVILVPPSGDDVGVSAVDSPISACGLSASESVWITISNYGAALAAGTNVPYSVKVDGGTPCTGTFTVPAGGFATGADTTFNSGCTGDFSAAGTHTVQAWTSLTGDVDNMNDTTTTTVTNDPLISTFPYTESFESGAGGWRVESNGTTTWALGELHATTTPGTIDTAANGTFAWETDTSGNYQNDEQGWVLSPCFDFSSMTNAPKLTMSVWWESENTYDGGAIDTGDAAGSSWARLGAMGDPNNWYNDNTISGLNWSGSQHGWTGTGTNSSGGWVEASRVISEFAGRSDYVRFRVLFGSDGSITSGDGFAFDYVRIEEVQNDVGVSVVDSPVSGCGLGPAEPIWITIHNYGSALSSGVNVPYSVEVDGGTPCTGTFTVPAGGFATGADTTFNSGCTGDFSTTGSHTVKAWTSLTGDVDNTNDTTTQTIEHKAAPTLGANDIFIDDFECLPPMTTQTSGTILMSGTPSSQWEYTNTVNGRLQTTYTNHTTGGSQAVTLDANPSGSNSDNWMTVTLDMSAYNAATNAIELEFWWTDHGDETHTGDSIAIRGSNSDPWINVLSLAPGSQTNNTWHQEAINLSNALQAAGQNFSSTFQIRFSQYDNFDVPSDGITYDDIRVHELQNDVGVSAVDSPVSGCGMGTAESVWITIHNYGAPLSSGTNVPYSVEVDGGTPCAGTLTIGTGGLATGADTTFNSGCTGDFSTLGAHTVKAWTSLAGDVDNTNDTTTQAVNNSPLYSTFPHVEGFEGTSYWTFGGTNSSWQVGTPSGGDIDAAGEGSQSLFTDNGLDEYNDNEQSFAESPCYDFSALTSDPIVSFLHAWELESSYDEGWLEYTTDGGATWTKVGASGSGVNWYNDAVNNWWDATNGYEDWHVASHVLTGLAGQSEVRFRFRMSSDGSVRYEGMAIDQFSVLPSGTEVFDPAARPYTGTSTATLSGSGWSKYQVAGGDVIWVDPNGNNLGSTDLKMNTEFPPLYFPSVGQYMTPRHWVVEPTTAPTSNVTLRLFLTEEEWDTLQGRDANLAKGVHLLGITHYHGPNDHTLSWTDNTYTGTNRAFIAPSAITVYPWNNGYGLEFDVPTLSQFGGNSGGGTNTPLPVEFAWFRADRVGGDALLRWATASERGSDHFRVETATEVRDGVPVWRLLGTVKAAGESRELREYEFVDREPNKRGVRYYRIVEVDADGTTTESEVRKLFFDGEAGVVTVRPNPFADALEVLLPSGEGTAQVQVEDVRGVTVWRRTVALGGVVQTLRVDASGLPAGVYTVRVITASGTEMVKVVKR